MTIMNSVPYLMNCLPCFISLWVNQHASRPLNEAHFTLDKSILHSESDLLAELKEAVNVEEKCRTSSPVLNLVKRGVCRNGPFWSV